MKINYIKYDEAGRMLQSGHTSKATFDARVAEGERLIQSDVDVNTHCVREGKVKPLTEEEKIAIQTTYENEVNQRFAKLPYTERRVTEYPRLADFADAVYWEKRGNPQLMDIWLRACDDVKAKHPKG